MKRARGTDPAGVAPADRPGAGVGLTRGGVDWNFQTPQAVRATSPAPDAASSGIVQLGAALGASLGGMPPSTWARAVTVSTHTRCAQHSGARTRAQR